MAALERSEVEVLADQVALVEAAADFAILKAQLNQARRVVEALARRLEPGVLTTEEAIAKAGSRAIKAVKEAKARLEARP